MIWRNRFVIGGIGLCSGEIGLWSVGSVCDLGDRFVIRGDRFVLWRDLFVIWGIDSMWGSVYDLGRSVCDLGRSRTRIVLCIAGGGSCRSGEVCGAQCSFKLGDCHYTWVVAWGRIRDANGRALCE